MIESTEDGSEFTVFYACKESDGATYHYVRSTEVGGRRVECRYAGELSKARAAKGYCATLEDTATESGPAAEPDRVAESSR
jgi:hypothetical protein